MLMVGLMVVAVVDAVWGLARWSGGCEVDVCVYVLLGATPTISRDVMAGTVGWRC